MSAPSGDRVTVVVLTHERRDELLRTLDHLTGLPERPPIVVCDNASRDGTAAAVRARYGHGGEHQYEALHVVVMPHNEGAVARNVGVATAATPYVAFCDDDTWWEPGSLARAAAVLDAHPDVAVLTGRIVVEPDGREDPINAELRESPVPGRPGLPGPALGSFLAGASVVRRDAFLHAGGFSDRLWLGGEEELLAADLTALGWEMCHLPDLVVHHQPSPARDADQRRRDGIRNTLWFTWLRRPLPAAARRTRDVVSSLPRDRVSVLGVLDAAGGLPWVLRERRVLPEHAERRFRALERSQRESSARRYVS